MSLRYVMFNPVHIEEGGIEGKDIFVFGEEVSALSSEGARFVSSLLLIGGSVESLLALGEVSPGTASLRQILPQAFAANTRGAVGEADYGNGHWFGKVRHGRKEGVMIVWEIVWGGFRSAVKVEGVHQELFVVVRVVEGE